MRKFIYQSIVERIQAEIPEIQHFDLWHNQLAYIEEEQPFELPAVLIEFLPIQWRHQSNGVREAAVEIALHVLTRQNEPQNFEFFDLLTEINCILFGYYKTNYNFGHDALTAIQSTTDNDFYEIRHDIEVFSCHAQDASAMPKLQSVKATLKIDT